MNIALIAHDAKKNSLFSFVLHIAELSADTMSAQPAQRESLFRKQQDSK